MEVNAMDSREAKYNNEDLVFNKVKCSFCKGCIFAENDVVYNGKVLFNGCDKAVCKKYPKQKPLEIMSAKQKCKFKKT